MDSWSVLTSRSVDLGWGMGLITYLGSCSSDQYFVYILDPLAFEMNLPQCESRMTFQSR